MTPSSLATIALRCGAFTTWFFLGLLAVSAQTARNLTNEVQNEQRYQANTPYYARNYGVTDTGAFFTLGVTGEF